MPRSQSPLEIREAGLRAGEDKQASAAKEFAAAARRHHRNRNRLLTAASFFYPPIGPLLTVVDDAVYPFWVARGRGDGRDYRDGMPEEFQLRNRMQERHLDPDNSGDRRRFATTESFKRLLTLRNFALLATATAATLAVLHGGAVNFNPLLPVSGPATEVSDLFQFAVQTARAPLDIIRNADANLSIYTTCGLLTLATRLLPNRHS